MTIKPRHADSVAFLQTLYPGGPWTLTAIHPSKVSPTGDAEIRTRTFDDVTYVMAFLDQHREWNLYYNVNPVTEPVDKKPERHEIAAVHYFHVDMDPLPGESPDVAWQRIYPKLSAPATIVPPTHIIRSGHGANALWAINPIVPIEGETPAERTASAEHAKGYSYQLELILGGADACHNVDRILRLPWTVNWPNATKIAKYGNADPTLSELVLSEPSRVYSPSQFVCAPPVVSGPKAAFGGQTRHSYSAGGNIERVWDITSLDLSKLRDSGSSPDELLMTITTGTPPDKYASRWGKDRSKMVLWVCRMLIMAGVPDDKIYAILTDERYPISSHVLDQKGGVKRYAERQIDRAHDMVVSEDLDWFNQRYAAIENAGRGCAVLKEGDELDFVSPGSFREFFSNKLVEVTKVDKKGNKIQEYVEAGSWWWKHPMRRSFSHVGFEPEKIVPGMYNLWRGFAEDPAPGDWSLFRELMLHNLCRGNKEHYEYLFKVLAYWFQHPGQQGHISVVLQGLEGTGKGTFGHTIGTLWGKHYYHLIHGDHLTGRFTGHLMDKVFIFADEAFFAGDNRNVDIIKGLITEPTISVEDKYVRIKERPNYLKLLIASNKDWVIKASAEARRWYVLRTADVHFSEVEKQRKAIDKQLDAGGRAGLLYDLLREDLSDFNIRRVPQTEALSQQREMSFEPHEMWFFNMLDAGEILPNVPWEQPVPVRLVMDSYYDHHAKSRYNGRTMPENAIGRFLSESVPLPAGRTLRINSDGTPKYRFPPLRECREHWSRIKGTRFNWPEEVTRPDAGGRDKKLDF